MKKYRVDYYFFREVCESVNVEFRGIEMGDYENIEEVRNWIFKKHKDNCVLRGNIFDKIKTDLGDIYIYDESCRKRGLVFSLVADNVDNLSALAFKNGLPFNDREYEEFEVEM